MISRVHCPIQLSVAKFLNVFFLGNVARNVGQKSVQTGYIRTSRHPPAEWVSGGHLSTTPHPQRSPTSPQPPYHPSFLTKVPLMGVSFAGVFCDTPPIQPTIMTKILQSPQNLQSAHCLCNSPHGAPWPNSALHCHQCLILFLPHSIFVRCLHSLNGKDLR